MDQLTHGCLATAEDENTTTSHLGSALVQRRMKHLALNILDACDRRSVGLDMEASAHGHMGTIKDLFLRASGTSAIEVSDAMLPAGGCPEARDPDDGTVQLNMVSECEVCNVGLEIVHICRQRHMVRRAQWEAVVGEGGELFAAHQLCVFVRAVVEGAADIPFTGKTTSSAPARGQRIHIRLKQTGFDRALGRGRIQEGLERR